MLRHENKEVKDQNIYQKLVLGDLELVVLSEKGEINEQRKIDVRVMPVSLPERPTQPQRH
jgi:hypothetical protein